MNLMFCFRLNLIVAQAYADISRKHRSKPPFVLSRYAFNEAYPFPSKRLVFTYLIF